MLLWHPNEGVSGAEALKQLGLIDRELPLSPEPDVKKDQEQIEYRSSTGLALSTTSIRLKG